jgi:hypothetical protein
MTSCGLNDGPLKGQGTYPAYIACNLYGKNGTRFLSMIKQPKAGNPFLTQDGKDREEGPDQYIANMCDGAVAGFKYFDLTNTQKIRVNVQGRAEGTLSVLTKETGKPAAQITIKPTRERHGFTADISNLTGTQALFFKFEGKGSFNFYSFDLK